MNSKSPETPKEEKIWKSSDILRKDKLNASERTKGLNDLAFEAKSMKDYAWFDVASFLTYRVSNSGELNLFEEGLNLVELKSTESYSSALVKKRVEFHRVSQEGRVRFSGFGKEEDEWVNVKDGVRERSIPLEPSECQKVRIGDHILCFKEREHFALYVDARIVGIRRRRHDPTDCTCIFVVHYEFDNSEEEVRWRRICCRPEGSDSHDDISTEDQKEICMDEQWKMSFLY